jgi:WbqC-like protein family
MVGKKIAILQSNYIPWKGYFDLIAAVDEFIIYDDVQFTKNDWRNRNKIKSPRGLEWLSIPVGQNISRRIRDVELPATNWRQQHWNKLHEAYRTCPYYEEVGAVLAPFYQSVQIETLTEFNRGLIEAICGYLGITTKISYAWDYPSSVGKTERLVDLCRRTGASEYISGPAAKAYLDESLFTANGIDVRWFDYSGYPQYTQLFGEFEHGVSVLDLLFNCGNESPNYMRHVLA